MRWLADENFDNRLLRAVLQRASLDIVRVQDAGLRGASDDAVLEWAANEDRIVLSHDVATLSDAAYRRVARQLKMPGVVQVSQAVRVSSAVEDILLISQCSEPSEWENQVRYLPLR